jgi:hypothetical protein
MPFAIQPNPKASHQSQANPKQADHHHSSYQVIEQLIGPMERNTLATPKCDGKQCARQCDSSAQPVPEPAHDPDTAERRSDHQNPDRHGLRAAPLFVCAKIHRLLHPEVMQLPSPIENYIQKQAELHHRKQRKYSTSRPAFPFESPSHHARQKGYRVRRDTGDACWRKPYLSGNHSLWCTL